MTTYRELRRGEKILRGDEYFERNKWVKFSSSVGDTVDEHWLSYKARRPIPLLTEEKFLECVRMLMALREGVEVNEVDREYAIGKINEFLCPNTSAV